jgi:hypothetical protein
MLLRHIAGQLDLAREVGGEGAHRQHRHLGLQLGDRLMQELFGNIDRNKALGGNRLAQAARLLAVAGAQLDHRAAGADPARDVGAVAQHDLALGARGVVLGQAGDLFEDLRAPLVIEILGRQGGRGVTQALGDFAHRIGHGVSWGEGTTEPGKPHACGRT